MVKHIWIGNLGLGLAAVVFGAIAGVAVEFPNTIRFQGYVVDAQGRPLGNERSENQRVVLRLYAEAEGGRSLWTEEQVVSASRGTFVAVLGTGKAYLKEPHGDLSQVFARADRAALFVGITSLAVNEEMSPRTKLVSVPFAFRSEVASRLESAKHGIFDPFVDYPLPIGGPLQSLGGAARGESAVDLQVVRLQPDQVASGRLSVVGGGSRNTASGSGSTVAGGIDSEATRSGSSVGGGWANHSIGDYTTIAGGRGNWAREEYGFVGGGLFNHADKAHSIIVAGQENRVLSKFSVVGGGIQNKVLTNASYSVILGGLRNQITGWYGTIAGGREGRVTEEAATIGGGWKNVASGNFSTVPGGTSNEAGGWASFAAGCMAKAMHKGTFVWADGQYEPFTSTGENQFLVRATNGVGINKNDPRVALDVAGNVSADGSVTAAKGVGIGKEPESALHVDAAAAEMTVNRVSGVYSVLRTDIDDADSSWEIAHKKADRNISYYHNGKAIMSLGPSKGDLWFSHSDRRLKTDVEEVEEGVLERLRELPVSRYRFKDDPTHKRHVGLIAQDVQKVMPEAVREADGHLGIEYARFGIYSIAGIKELDREVTDLRAKNAQLEKNLASLLKRIEKLEQGN